MHGQLLSLPLNPRFAPSAHLNCGVLRTRGQGCCGRENLTTVMEHLACFVPGNLALGVESGAVSGAKAEEYLALAAELSVACFQMYSQQPTGAQQLSPKLFNSNERTSMRGAFGRALCCLLPDALAAARWCTPCPRSTGFTVQVACLHLLCLKHAVHSAGR